MTLSVASKHGGWRSENDALAAKLAALVERLARPRQRIEGAFLEIGGCLIEGNRLLSNITATFETLRAGLENRDGASAFGYTEAVARKAITVIGSSARETADLTPLAADIARIREPVNELTRAVNAIGMAVIGTQISAAHLSGTGDGFKAFTGDIEHLSKRATAAMTRFTQSYDRLVATVAEAGRKRSVLKEKEERILSGLVERLDESLRTAIERQRRASEACGEISLLFKRTGSDISSTVSALQIGDITRQRIEHIEEGLTSLVEPSKGALDDQSAALISAVCRLQSAQAAQTHSDFERDVGGVVQSLHRLAADAGNIVDRSRSIHADMVQASRAAREELVREVATACSLMRECQAARTELDKAALAVSDSLGDMLNCIGSVQRIKKEMHILGINMALKCVRLGYEGRALDAIATEVRELAQKTVRHSQAAATQLNTAVAMASDLTKLDSGSADVDEIGSLEGEVRRIGDLPEDTDGHLQQALDVLRRDGTKVAELLGTATQKITLQQDIGGALRSAMTEIEDIRDQAKTAYAALSDGVLQDAEAEALGRLEGSYTMASERALHEQLSGNGRPEVMPERDEGDGGESGLDDIFL